MRDILTYASRCTKKYYSYMARLEIHETIRWTEVSR